MKHVFTHLAFLCLFGSLFAQQDPHFSQFMHNKLFMNPAYAGMKHGICLSMIARQQWAGFEGAPKSGIFSGDIYFDDISSGFGFNLVYDQLGFERNGMYQFAYSKHIEGLFGGDLAIGINVGAASKILGPTGGTSWVSTNNWQSDPTIPPQLRKTNFDCGFGLWYDHKKFWFGISTSHLTEGQFDDGSVVINNLTHPILYSISRHYWITGGYNYQFRSWTLKPSFILKSDAVVTSFDLNCIASMNNGFWLGASWRINDAVCPMVGFEWMQPNNLFSKMKYSDPGLDPDYHDDGRPKTDRYSTYRIGFAYDYTTSRMAGYSNGTFEIFLNYCMPWEPRRGGGKDIRIFN